MGLSNAASRARNYSQTVNQPQGGGDKKAGFPYQVGRTHWTPIFLGCSQYQIRCCELKNLKLTANPNVRQSRPMGSNLTPNPYWKIA